LDRNRQIVFANTQAADFFGVSSLNAFVGKRTGEAIGCIHIVEEKDALGCGATKFCGSAALRIWSVPFHVGKETVTLVIIRNIAWKSGLNRWRRRSFMIF